MEENGTILLIFPLVPANLKHDHPWKSGISSHVDGHGERRLLPVVTAMWLCLIFLPPGTHRSVVDGIGKCEHGVANDVSVRIR